MNQVEIYTRPGCGYCDHAKSYLQSRNIKYVEYDVYHQPGAFEQMSKRTTNRTYPQVFINNMNVGGFVELVKVDLNDLS